MENTNRITSLIRAMVVLLAATLLLVGYYWIHTRQGDSDVLLRFAGYGLHVVVTFGLFAISGGIGRSATNLFFQRSQIEPGIHRAERLALDGGMGLALISFGGLALGLVGLFQQIVLITALIVVAVLFRKPIKSWLADGVSTVRTIHFASPFTSFLIVIAVLLLGLAMVSALTPPYAWDAMTYHLVEPLHLLETGRITASDTNFYLGFPKAVETLFAIVMGITGQSHSTGLIHFGIGILALLGVAGCARRFTNAQAGWLAVVLLLSSYNTWQLFSWQYVDLAVMLYGALAFIIALRWHENKHTAWLILLGMSCGFGFGVKYSFGSLMLALGIFILLRQPRRFIPNLLIFGLTAGIAYLPWALRGLLLYDNPIYPYLLGGLNWTPERTIAFNQTGQGMVALGRIAEVPFLPFTATILGFNYDTAYSYTLGPFLLTLPFLLIFTWRRLPDALKRAVSDGAIILIPVYVYWALSMLYIGIAIQTRLVIFILPISAILGAMAVWSLDLLPEKPINVGFLIRAMISITTLLGTISIISNVAKTHTFEVVLGTITSEEFLFGQLSTHPAVMRQLDELPADSQVRFLFELRSYYCPEDITCLTDSLFDFWGRARREGMTPDEIFEAWRTNGDDYVLFFQSGYNATSLFSWTPEYDPEIFDALAEHMTPVWTSDGGFYTLYTWPE